jgi:hypothetical protein
MLFLARWARKLSWKETAESFHTSWDKVCDAVESVVAWDPEHRTLASIRAIGVDEMQYAKGHKYLTLVYQIDQGFTRWLWVGKERTIESFQGFFTVTGEQLAARAAPMLRESDGPQRPAYSLQSLREHFRVHSHADTEVIGQTEKMSGHG